jgi:hypothetical protein
MRATRAWLACLGVGLGGLAVIVVGCSSEPRASAPKSAGGPAGEASREAVPKADADASGKLIADWPTGPNDRFAGALIISGEMFGYHEPCGCTAKQKGGLVRRATFVELLRKQGWNVGLVDLGSLVKDPNKARGGFEQEKLKFTSVLKALDQMGYAAVGLSPEDLELGTAETLMAFDNTLAGPARKLRIVCANATPVADLGFEKTLRPSVRTEVGAVKVGITSVIDHEAFAALGDPEKTTFLTLTDPIEALTGVLADLEKDTNVQVLLVQGPPELAKRLAARFPGLDVVVSTSEFTNALDKPEVVNDGKTWVVDVGHKGMYVGVVGFYLDPKERLRYRRIELNDRFDRHRDLAAATSAIIGDEFQASLKAAGVLQSYPKRPYALFDVPSDATYVGAETCKTCHPKTFEKWASTKHSHAYEPLINDPRDDGRNRENDAACVSCHTTGFEYTGGFVTTEITPHLKGNQCENCHGPGSKHAREPDSAEYRKAIARLAADFDKSHRCIQCHDEDNDPNFNFGIYWPQIMHSKLDTYDDPKVHQGVANVAPGS